MSVDESDNDLDERSSHLFRVLVESYINDGQPVGSRSLAKRSELALSPATVRNVMADLEELGYLQSPHTSAGRVPTAKGYRLFVDTMVKVQPIHARLEAELKNRLHASNNRHELIAAASSLLSKMTHMAGVVTVPRKAVAAFRQIEFLQLSDRRVLVILVVNQKEVQNRIIHLDRDYSADDLRVAANYLNDILAGQTLHGIRRILLSEMDRVRQDMNDLMKTAVALGEQVFSADEHSQKDYVVEGQINLMEFEELSDIEKLRGLFEAFHRKKDILHLLDRCICAQGVQIFIGQESGCDVFGDCSVVSSPYSINDDIMGVLAVVGPTRMAYDRVIPVVDLTAKILGEALHTS